jgi:hypothetical protein
VTGSQLATLSTIAWLVGTTVLFALLARWSDGGSWGITTAVTRGLIGWSGRKGSIAGEWPSGDEWPSPGRLPTSDAPASDRPSGAHANPAATNGAAGSESLDSAPIAELVDLGARRLS